jgi:hypothetical protein
MRISFRHHAAPALAAALLLNLAACNSAPQNLSADDTDDQKEALAHAKPVELPPSIQASKSYRCKDNSTVHIDWFSGDKQAAVKLGKETTATMLKADAPATTKTAEGGFALSGAASDPTVDLTTPGKDKLSCKS